MINRQYHDHEARLTQLEEKILSPDLETTIILNENKAAGFEFDLAYVGEEYTVVGYARNIGDSAEEFNSHGKLTIYRNGVKLAKNSEVFWVLATKFKTSEDMEDEEELSLQFLPLPRSSKGKTLPGFTAEVDARFSALEGGGTVDVRIGLLESRATNLESNISTLEDRVATVEAELDSFEKILLTGEINLIGGTGYVEAAVPVGYIFYPSEVGILISTFESAAISSQPTIKIGTSADSDKYISGQTTELDGINKREVTAVGTADVGAEGISSPTTMRGTVVIAGSGTGTILGKFYFKGIILAS